MEKNGSSGIAIKKNINRKGRKVLAKVTKKLTTEFHGVKHGVTLFYSVFLFQCNSVQLRG